MEISELRTLCKEVADARDLYNEKKGALNIAEAALDVLENKLVAALNENKLDKGFKTEFGDFSIRHDMSVPTPKGDEKLKFFEHLREIGQFDAMISVNSRTLNAWFKQEDEAAKAKGEPYAIIPGLEMPKAREVLVMRKAK